MKTQDTTDDFKLTNSVSENIIGCLILFVFIAVIAFFTCCSVLLLSHVIESIL